MTGYDASAAALRVGIIGGGFMGTVHARSVRRIGARVTRVASSTPESSERAARLLGADQVSATADDLIASADVDVVHVCTPNATHVPLARAALAAGKHVVCEKPLGVDSDEASGLAELAAASGRIATVPFVYRFYPSVREARSRLRGTDIRLIHGSYLQDWLAFPGDDDWRVASALGGPSRAFADIGVHWCDLVEFVTGHRITRLIAQTSTFIPTRSGAAVTTEDAAAMLFSTDRGASGSVTVSQVSHGRKNRLWFSIDADQESVSFDQENPDSLWVGGRAANQTIMRGADDSAAAARYTAVPAGHPQGYQDCFDAFIADTYAAIGGQTVDGLPAFSDGFRAAQLTTSVLKSAQNATWVDVPAPHPTSALIQ